jgi:hypothetical protein
MNLYKCLCGEALDIDDGKKCRKCFAAQHCNQCEGLGFFETVAGELSDCKHETKKKNKKNQGGLF